MALVLKDRVKETTTSTGTGSITLDGASTGYQSFSVVGDGNTTYYTIAAQTGNEWEVGIGTYTLSGTVLARTTVLSNSSGTQPSALNFSAGTKDVFVTYPSGKSVNLDASGNVSALGTIASGTWQATTIGINSGGTGQTTQQAALTALSGTQASGQYLRSNGTNTLLSAIQVADVPTLNQSTTGSAATLTTGRTIAITGDLAYTSPSFDGSANVTAAGTLATVNTNVGSFTNATLTVNGKGLITAASSGTAPVTSVTATSPVASTGGATPVISMPAATTAVSGYLTSTDWTTFNSKGSGTVTSVSGTAGRITSTGGTTPVLDLASGVATAGTTGSASLIPVVTIDTYGRVTSITTAANPQGTVTSVTGTAPVVSSGGATPAISMAAATALVNGYLTSTDWTTFNNKSNTNGTVTSVAALTLGTTGTDLSSTVATGTTTPVITLQVPTASAANRGALSAADWTTFNNKGSGTVTSVTGTAPVVSSGGAAPAISMAAATTSVNGYLTSTDWTTFNNKGSGTITSVTGTAPVVSSGGTTPAISMAAATTSVSGYLTSTDWTTFNNKGSGTVTSVTATSPVASTGGATPVISMPAATTSVNGYLTSTDWNTFNGKGSGTVTSVAALTLGTTGTDLGSTVANGTTTPVITLNVPTASATNRGALSSADWTTFNNKGSGTVTSVTGTSPVVSSGGATPAISMAAATTSVSGYLTSTDWTTFNNKGSGTVTSVAATVPSFLSVSGSPVTTSGTLAITLSGTALPILNGGTGQTTASAAFNALSPVTTTGDLIIGNGANSTTRLAIGTSTHVLTSNGTTATWAASGGVSTGNAFIISMVFGG